MTDKSGIISSLSNVSFFLNIQRSSWEISGISLFTVLILPTVIWPGKLAKWSKSDYTLTRKISFKVFNEGQNECREMLYTITDIFQMGRVSQKLGGNLLGLCETKQNEMSSRETRIHKPPSGKTIPIRAEKSDNAKTTDTVLRVTADRLSVSSLNLHVMIGASSTFMNLEMCKHTCQIWSSSTHLHFCISLMYNNIQRLSSHKDDLEHQVHLSTLIW